jgi:hypothetical protein
MTSFQKALDNFVKAANLLQKELRGVKIREQQTQDFGKKSTFPKDRQCFACRRFRAWYLFQRYRNICLDCVELLNS